MSSRRGIGPGVGEILGRELPVQTGPVEEFQTGPVDCFVPIGLEVIVLG